MFLLWFKLFIHGFIAWFYAIFMLFLSYLQFNHLEHLHYLQKEAGGRVGCEGAWKTWVRLILLTRGPEEPLPSEVEILTASPESDQGSDLQHCSIFNSLMYNLFIYPAVQIQIRTLYWSVTKQCNIYQSTFRHSLSVIKFHRIPYRTRWETRPTRALLVSLFLEVFSDYVIRGTGCAP